MKREDFMGQPFFRSEGFGNERFGKKRDGTVSSKESTTEWILRYANSRKQETLFWPERAKALGQHCLEALLVPASAMSVIKIAMPPPFEPCAP